MEIQNCRICKRIFNYVMGEPICPQCRILLEDKFEEVKEYIKENPNKKADQVAEACDVSIKRIRAWVREERLVFSDASLAGLECERCHSLIASGRFCDKCASGLASAIGGVVVTKVEPLTKEQKDNRMRFLQ